MPTLKLVRCFLIHLQPGTNQIHTVMENLKYLVKNTELALQFFQSILSVITMDATFP